MFGLCPDSKGFNLPSKLRVPPSLTTVTLEFRYPHVKAALERKERGWLQEGSHYNATEENELYQNKPYHEPRQPSAGHSAVGEAEMSLHYSPLATWWSKILYFKSGGLNFSTLSHAHPLVQAILDQILMHLNPFLSPQYHPTPASPGTFPSREV